MWTASYEASGSVTVDGVLYSSYTQSKTPVSEDSTYLGISPPCQHVYTDVRSNFSIFDTPNNTFSSSVYTQFSPKLYSGDYDIENNETEYLYAFTKADFMTEARNLVTNFIVPEECWNTVFFLSSFKEDSGFAENATAAKGRFRFRIPTTHLGTKFTITYDVGEFPTGGDPSFVSQDNVVEWTGPGTGASSDPSWLTPWVEIDPPEVPGERRVVNIRFTCYTGTKYGSKPQVMGEALELPPP